LRSRVALARGDTLGAWAHLRQALSLARDLSTGYEIAVTLANIAEAKLLAGETALAAELATAALSEGGEVLRVRLQAEAVLSQTGHPTAARTTQELAATLLC
jgi:hypothetical protein